MESVLMNPALTVALAVSAGMVAHVAARHLQIPSIVLLLLTGALLGPEVLGVVHPESLGRALFDIVGMAVAVVLFEGGLSLSLKRIREEVVILRRLITVGAALTAVVTTLAARLLMDWPWELAVPFGALMVVTGPTVVQPVLRRVPVRRGLATILEAEAVLIDGIGAILAVVALEFVLAAGAPEDVLLVFSGHLAVGVSVGIAGGLLIGLLLGTRNVIPEGLENGVALALVLALFQGSEAVLHETGIMAAAVAGIVVGNTKTPVDRELQEFKEQLTVFLLALLFVLLAATVQLRDVVELGWAGIGTVLAVMLSRPLSVAASTGGGQLDLPGRAFLSWLAPRGVVAAAVSALFAQRFIREGVPGAEEFQALVFLVIAATVVFQGGLAGPVASALGVRQEEPMGYLIAGANPVGRALAHALEVAGEDAVLLDTSDEECREASREGLNVIQGSALDERVLHEAGASERQGVVAVTPSPSLNLRVVEGIREQFGVASGSVSLNRVHGGLEEMHVRESGVQILFGRAIDVEHWTHEFRVGRMDIARWTFEGSPKEGNVDPDEKVWLPDSGVELLPLVLVRDEVAGPITDRTELRPGDDVYFAWPYTGGVAAGQWLSKLGWKPAAEAPADD